MGVEIDTLKYFKDTNCKNVRVGKVKLFCLNPPCRYLPFPQEGSSLKTHSNAKVLTADDFRAILVTKGRHNDHHISATRGLYYAMM